MARLGIDVGGTFVDLVLETGGGALVFEKVLAESADVVGAIMSGVCKVLERGRISGSDIREVVHATTRGSNTVLERSGPRTALVVTRGFRDILQIQRALRWSMYDVQLDKPAPLVERSLSFEVSERMLPDGSVLRPLAEEELGPIVEQVRASAVEAIAIAFLHSYANPRHERRAAAVLGERLPGVVITVSSDVSLQAREYERANTAAVNSYITRSVSDYLSELLERLPSAGVTAPVWIMQSSGGLASIGQALEWPVRTVESGPAAGVVGAARFGTDAGYPDVIAFDMGGTTAKAAVVSGGVPSTTPYFELQRVGNRRGSGLPVDIAALDLVEVGTGGGSIAEVREGTLRVGPRSAGADPGPACYGRGGVAPTVTDANVVLGYCDPSAFAGGIELDVGRAEMAIDRLAAELGVDRLRAAWGVHEVATMNMEHAIRLVSINRGFDPRTHGLVCLGGGGPVHGPRLARALGARVAVIPRAASGGSARGMLEASASVEVTQTALVRLDDHDASERCDGILAKLIEETGSGSFAAQGDVDIACRLGVRYVGQGYELLVPIDLSRRKPTEIVSAFHERYEQAYGYAVSDQPVEVVSWHLRLVRRGPEQAFAPPRPGSADRQGPGRREVFFPETGSVEVDVYRRSDLRAGETVAGPCLVTETTTTTVVLPGDTVSVAAEGALVVHVGEGELSAVGGTGVDSLTVAVVWGRLAAIAEEMAEAQQRCAYSDQVREGGDYSTAVFDVSGRMLAQANRSPAHLGAMPHVVRNMLGAYPPETLEPGDMVVLNDPYMGSGHLPDLFAMSPSFDGERLIGFVVSSVHLTDVGGPAPGSQAVVGVTDLVQEGLRLLPARIYRRGEPVREIFDLLAANVRVPDPVLGDIRAQRAALHVGARKLAELHASTGIGVIDAVAEEILARSEQAVRRELLAIPDGTATFVDYLDDYGPQTPPIRMEVAVTINGSDVTFDFTGTDPQTPSSLNCTLSYTTAYCYWATKAITTRDAIPQNEGQLRAVHVVAPPGCFFNPVPPAALNGRALVNQRIVELIFGALAKVIPDRLCAASGQWLNPIFGGIEPGSGRPFVFYDYVMGGVGARATKDGIDAISPTVSVENIPVEVQEARNPIVVERYGLIPDSGGAGRYRGGLGVQKDVRMLADHVVLSNLTDRHVFPAYGLFGGRDGLLGETVLNPGTPEAQKLHSKEVVQLRLGDVVSFRCSGSGGFGPAAERPREQVLEDVREGRVTLAAARELYGLDVEA